MSAATAAVPRRPAIGRGAAISIGVLVGLIVLIIITGYGPAVVELLGWFISFLLTRPYIIFGFAVPIGYGAMCAVMNERSGVVNIGIEGMMLTAAFVGFLAGAYLHPVIGDLPAALVGVFFAVVSAMLFSALHAWLSITVKSDQIINGTVINILAIGGTAYFNQLLVSTAGVSGAATLPKNILQLPKVVYEIPVLGPLLNAVFGQGPLQMSLLFLVILLQVLLFRSRWGLRTRAVGEHPKAADTVGIDVIRVRYRNVILGGIFAGLGGAYLTLESFGAFQDGMTNGVGFIAIAAIDLRPLDPGRSVHRGAHLRRRPDPRPGDPDRRAARRHRAVDRHVAGPDLRDVPVHPHDRHPRRRRRPSHPPGGRRDPV